ncbi:MULTISPECIES: transposase [unclassified Streptomyces]|uniref:transposase n=1 Tax=unclassified Streptomyces TaxID=2593676 RepID=UPI003D8CA24F
MRCGPRVELLTTITGQDVEEGEGCIFPIARKVAKDRTISTVDPTTRHGHKTAARGFDGSRGHIAVDPDGEIITATTATSGDTGDAEAAEPLLADIVDDTDHGHPLALSAGEPLDSLIQAVPRPSRTMRPSPGRPAALNGADPGPRTRPSADTARGVRRGPPCCV